MTHPTKHRDQREYDTPYIRGCEVGEAEVHARMTGDADAVVWAVLETWPGMYRREDFAQKIIDRLRSLIPTLK